MDRPDEPTRHERGQIASAAAEVYEDFFVPALFGQWADPMLDAGDVGRGSRILDVGCGTGVLARAAAIRVGEEGRVVGLDPNSGMLAVARRAGPGIEWREGRAEELPFRAGEFDAVVSQFAVMFFEDAARGLAEMARVLTPGGTLAIATWASLDESPGYSAMAGLLEEVIGPEAARALAAPFRLGDPAVVEELVAGAFRGVAVRRVEGTARFDSIDRWVETEIRGWTLREAIDDDENRRLSARAGEDLARFADAEGRVAFPCPALLTTARRPPDA